VHTCSTASLLVLVLLLGGLPAPVQAQQDLAPGEVLPSLGETLRRMDGTRVSPRRLGGAEGTVFLFWSNRCPWVEKYYGRIDSLATRYEGRGVQFVLVNANDAEAAAVESLGASRRHADEQGYELPYVRDPSAQLARTLGAVRTPSAFVFGTDWGLRYRGAIDDSPGLPAQAGRSYLRAVLEALTADETVPYRSHPSFGCTLKYPEDASPE